MDVSLARVGHEDSDGYRVAVAWTADASWPGYQGDSFELPRVFVRVAEVDAAGLQWVTPAQPVFLIEHRANNTYREPRLARGATGLGVLLHGDIAGNHRLA